MKEILLTQNQVALIDDEDFERVSRFKWNARWKVGTKSFYAVRKDADLHNVYMSRFILGCSRDDEVDHKNHKTLDNQKYNLRICTRSQNHQNQRPHTNGSSEYKGVCWDKATNRWKAQIHTKDIFDRPMDLHLGRFEIEEEAALAYDEAASKEFGEFAWLNFP